VPLPRAEGDHEGTLYRMFQRRLASHPSGAAVTPRLFDALDKAEPTVGVLWQHRGDQWRLPPAERRPEDEEPPVGRDNNAGPRPCAACLERGACLGHLLPSGAYTCDAAT